MSQSPPHRSRPSHQPRPGVRRRATIQANVRLAGDDTGPRSIFTTLSFHYTCVRPLRPEELLVELDATVQRLALRALSEAEGNGDVRPVE